MTCEFETDVEIESDQHAVRLAYVYDSNIPADQKTLIPKSSVRSAESIYAYVAHDV